MRNCPQTDASIFPLYFERDQKQNKPGFFG